MKRVSILLLCLLLALTGLTACGRDKNKNEADKGNQNNMTQNGDAQTPGGEIADGAGEIVQGTARGVRDLWDGLMEAFGMDGRPRTVEGDDAAFVAYGLTDDLIEEHIFHVPENSDTAHEFLIARVREGKMAEVEKILEARKEAIAAQWADGANDAMAYAREPVIYKSGNYIMLAVYDDPDMLRTEFERLVGEMEKK